MTIRGVCIPNSNQETFPRLKSLDLQILAEEFDLCSSTVSPYNELLEVPAAFFSGIYSSNSDIRATAIRI